MPDDRVCEIANSEQRIMITNDKDFGEIVFYQQKITYGIILLRVKGQNSSEIMFGKPVIKGTRLPVDLILEKLAYGYTQEKLEDEYPFITKEDIQAVLLYTSKAISLEEEILVA